MKMKSFMKKLFCVILSVAVFAVGIPFTVIAADTDDVNFAILSDIHYFASSSMGYTDEDKQEFNEMMLLNNSTSGLAPYLTEAALANIALMAKNGEIDFVLLPGDLTRNAEYAAHVELTNRLAQFEAETGIPVYVINGNHDINNNRSMTYDGNNLIDSKDHPERRDELDTTPEEFEALYKDFGYSSEGGYYSRYKAKAENSEGSLSYAIDIDDNYRLIAIDSQLYSADNTDSGENEQETAGHVSDALLEWTLNECAKAKADGKTIIGLTHTNVIPHFDTEVDLFDNFVLRDWERFSDAVADAGMHYMVSGHVHMQDVATYVNDNGEEISDIATASVLSYPNQFRTVNMQTAANGNSTLTYNTFDVDEVVPVIINGVAQPAPIKYQTWAYNFGGSNIKNFVMNVLEYELRYGFGKDIKNAGGLYRFLNQEVGLDEVLGSLTGNDFLDGVAKTVLTSLIYSLCNQVEKAYLKDIDATLDIIEPLLDKLLSIEVSDYPSTNFQNTLGFAGTGEKGTLGELASTVLAYHYENDENPENDKFLMSALDRFYNNQNGEVILNTLIDVVLDDLLIDTVLDTINIDLISLGMSGYGGEILEFVINGLGSLLGTGDYDGFSLADVVSLVLMTGLLDGDKLSDAVRGLLSEYLTDSTYEILDGEFYRILKDMTHDRNPSLQADFAGTISYTGKVAVPLSQENLRLPSHIAVTFGEDSATTRNISYYTKYSVTNTDIQIVPYSANPDFSKGSTVSFTADTNCETDVMREYAAIDLGFIGILYQEVNANRHTIKLSGLEAGKKYCYRIGDASRNWWSDIGVIDTADNSTAFSFFHMTDPQGVTEMQYTNNWAITLDTAFKNHADADFILSTGDLVDNGGDFRQWQRMFNTAVGSLMDTALQTAAGNHEEKGDFANENYFIYSGAPTQDTTTGVYYSFDYNTAHIAVLNTNNLNEDGSLSADQLEWLKADMNASNKAWKFVTLHKAPYSNGSHFDDDDVVALRAQLQGLMPELDIDIVFQGHDHVFMRTDVMKNNAVVQTETEKLSYKGLDYTSKISPDGTIYSINGTAGPKHYAPKAESETSKLFPVAEAVIEINVPSYSYIQIDGGNLYFDSYSVTDGAEERIDQFAISKVITLEDGTVIDGTNGNEVDDSNKNENGNENDTENNGSGIMDNIADTFRENDIYGYVAVAIGSLLVIAGVVTTIVVIKRRREEI